MRCAQASSDQPVTDSVRESGRVDVDSCDARHAVDESDTKGASFEEPTEGAVSGGCITLFDNQLISEAVVILRHAAKITINRSDFVRVSHYFRAAFCGDFLEATAGLVSLEHIEVTTFLQCCALIRGLLSGTSNFEWMTLKTAFKILDVASFLIIDVLLERLASAIPSIVAADSLIAAFRYAECRHFALSQTLWKIITENFDKLYLNNTYLLLRGEELFALLREKRLNIDPSQEPLMIEAWIRRNDGRRDCELIKEMRRSYTELSFPGRKARIPHSALLATGGWVRNGPTDLVETLDPHARTWVTSAVPVIGEPRAYHAMVSTGHDLIAVGGYNGIEYFRGALRFRLETLEWEEIAPAHDKRCYVSAAALGDERVIALGGHNEIERLRSAEILHVPSNQWTRVANMNATRSDAHCTVVDGLPYVVGGFDGFSCHSTVEYYDPHVDQWNMCRETMTTRRSGVGAITIGGAICVCGGFDGVHRLRTCELADPREGLWHRLQPMLYARSNFGIEALNNSVVVVGGYGGGVGTIAEAEAFDLRANAWLLLPAMHARRSALFVTLLQDLDLIEALLEAVPSLPHDLS